MRFTILICDGILGDTCLDDEAIGSGYTIDWCICDDLLGGCIKRSLCTRDNLLFVGKDCFDGTSVDTVLDLYPSRDVYTEIEVDEEWRKE